jgi:hypothetical protein
MLEKYFSENQNKIFEFLENWIYNNKKLKELISDGKEIT